MSRPLKQEKKEFSKINFSHNLKFPYLSSNLQDEKPHSMHHCQWGKNFIKLFSWVVMMYQTITSGMLLFYYMHDPLHYLEQKFTQTTTHYKGFDNKWQHKQILWSFVLFFQMIRLQTRDLFFTLPERKLVLRMLSAKEFLRCWPKHLPLLLFIGYLERQDNGTVIWSFCI